MKLKVKIIDAKLHLKGAEFTVDCNKYKLHDDGKVLEIDHSVMYSRGFEKFEVEKV